MERPAGELSGLVAGAQAGDRVAFERIVALTARVVYAQIVAAVRDRQKAEDLTQETYLSAWRAIGTVKEPEGVVSWLLVIARNTVRDAARFEGRARRRGTEVLESEPAGALDPPGAALERQEAQRRALELLEELPKEYRAALRMRYLGGADYETMRRALGLTDGALRGVLHRGMALLRERMSKVNREGE